MHDEVVCPIVPKQLKTSALWRLIRIFDCWNCRIPSKTPITPNTLNDVKLLIIWAKQTRWIITLGGGQLSNSKQKAEVLTQNSCTFVQHQTIHQKYSMCYICWRLYRQTGICLVCGYEHVEKHRIKSKVPNTIEIASDHHSTGVNGTEQIRRHVAWVLKTYGEKLTLFMLTKLNLLRKLSKLCQPSCVEPQHLVARNIQQACNAFHQRNCALRWRDRQVQKSKLFNTALVALGIKIFNLNVELRSRQLFNS
ncbi:Hypothetical_protein [Hexamita inflata]|uniref:Hypothetical_protein n=1 Tax=Hexamita inflata TaxID=28002 RepID=A0AA86V0E7_9EUKA|nr:Hypothetical protein HINF_LOCUS59012 [Hexamita inflata]